MSGVDYDSPYFFRACDEDFHYETLRKIFALPPRVSSPTQSSSSGREEHLSRVLSFRGYHSNQPAGGYLSKLKPDHTKIFYWKDCVVYGLHSGLTGQLGSVDTRRLLERGYRAWFPRRSADRDIDDGSFWGIFVWFRLRDNKMEEDKSGSITAKGEETGELAQAWSFHETFCEQLKRLAADIEESRESKAGWELRKSSTEVVMIVEPGWQGNGVRLTWKKDPTMQYVGLAPEELRRVEQESQDGFWELRCPLERAIRIVASRDPERRGGVRAEWNHHFLEMLVDGDDGSEVSELVEYYQSFHKACICV
ncbi:MAG: hypothetical protein Q9226_005404 [Calogaya cf. arnoldii]